MVSSVTQRFPIAHNFMKDVERGDFREIVRGSLRLVVAAVAVIALGIFPTLTARVTSIPYVGSYVAAGIAKFQLLTPLMQYAAVGAVSVPALALAGGAYFLASGVAAAYQATMAMSLIGGLDMASKLGTGLFLLSQCHKVKVGALEASK